MGGLSDHDVPSRCRCGKCREADAALREEATLALHERELIKRFVDDGSGLALNEAQLLLLKRSALLSRALVLRLRCEDLARLGG